MSHKLLRLTQSLQNKPLLIEENTFKEYMEYLDSRNLEHIKMEDTSEGQQAEYKRYTYNADTKAGVIELYGPLTYRSTFWQALCGGYSYQALKEDFEDLIGEGAKTIAMIVSSPGGEAHGMSDSAQYIRQILDANGVKLIAFVDGMAASAGYGLTSIADEIVSTKDSELGSIGVVVQIFNDSKALEKEGYQRTFITAGAAKVPFTDDGTWREGFLEDLQEKVNICYEDFTYHVSAMRNLPIQQIKDTEARMFFAEEAMSLGLCDAIMTPEEFYDYFGQVAQMNMGKTPMNVNRIFNLNKEEVTTDMTQLADLQAQLQSKDAELSALAEKVEAFASMEGLFAEAQAALAAKEVELSAAIEKVQAMETQAKEAKLQARKDKLAAVTSADQVEALAASLSSLDDAAFSTVVGAMAAQAKAVENSEMFTEVGDQGVEASVEETAAPKTSTTDALIQARLQNR